jgi:hypothetical protein
MLVITYYEDDKIGASVAQSVQRLSTGWASDGSEFESRKGKKCSLLHIVQTGSGVNLSSYPKGTESAFPGIKWQERETDYSPPTSPEAKITWIYTFTYR